VLNKFIQPDTIVPHPFNSQAFNRYSYVYNNPLTYIDPTGHGTICNEEGQCWINGQTSTTTIHPEDYDHEDWEMPSEVITPQPLRPPICNDEGTCYTNGQEIPSNIPSLPNFQDYAHDDWEPPLELINSILANEWTPLITDLIQLGAAIGLAAIGPGLAILAVVLGIVSLVAMVTNLASLDYQADHELYGVTQTDFNISVVSNLAAPIVGGIIPEALALKLGRELPKAVEYFFELILPAYSVIDH
jgi:hypothetical protein